MLKRFVAIGLCSVLSATGVSLAGDGDKGESAREIEAVKGKGDPKKGSDLSARLDALEKQVRELAMMIKHQGGKPHEKVAGKEAPSKEPMKKPGSSPEAHAKAVAAKLAAVKSEEAAKYQKPQAKIAPEKASPAKKPEGKPGESPLVIKGKDGELYVKLAALPKDFQQKFHAAGGHDGKADGGAKVKKAGKDDDDDDDNDDDDDKKAPSKKGAKDD